MIEFKMSDFFYPLDLLSTYLLLRRSERWSVAQFEAYQADRLLRLLRHCAAQVPYYAPVFRRAGLDVDRLSDGDVLASLRKLPVLDKDTLRESPELFLARNAHCFRPKPVHTSGTTGTPLTVYWDRGSNVMEFCNIQRLWRWARFRIGQPFLDLRSRPLSGMENHAVLDGDFRYIRNRKVNGLEFSSDFMDDSNIARYHALLLRHQPRLVRGHPQSIQHLIDLLTRNGLSGWQPRAVTTASETLHDFQRRQIEEAWHVPVLDSYGLIEHNVFIAQCPLGSYHISPEYGICEIVGDDGNPTPPGEEGWIVATGLHNFAQPLLRYNTRDRAIAAGDEVCPCGRTLPTVRRIVGRIDDCLHTVDGRRYSGLSFAFFGLRGVKKARFVQEDLERVTVELVTTSEFDQAERNRLAGILAAKVDHKLAFDFKLVDVIEQTSPGKFKFVVSNISGEVDKAEGC